MDRDRRLTGYLRGQTDRPTAPPGFEFSNGWRVRLSSGRPLVLFFCTLYQTVLLTASPSRSRSASHRGLTRQMNIPLQIMKTKLQINTPFSSFFPFALPTPSSHIVPTVLHCVKTEFMNMLYILVGSSHELNQYHLTQLVTLPARGRKHTGLSYAYITITQRIDARIIFSYPQPLALRRQTSPHVPHASCTTNASAALYYTLALIWPVHLYPSTPNDRREPIRGNINSQTINSQKTVPTCHEKNKQPTRNRLVVLVLGTDNGVKVNQAFAR